MGKGQILSGGANGLYTVRLDYGEAERTAELVRIAAQLIDLNNKSLAVGSQITTVDGEIATAQSAVSTAISNYEAAIIANQPLGPFEKAIVDAQAALAAAVTKKAPLANEKARLDGQIKNTQGRQSLLENLPTQQTKSVWCVDLTEDGSGEVGTIEVPGEPKTTLLVPGAVAPTPADGNVVARELLRYDQLFVNAALLPGWQKFKPTYRTGTITNINGDVCTVNLDLAESSAKELPINQTTFLNNVPIQYLDCNGTAFEDGDKVIVKFEGQNWATPKVIGFVDNPKACSIYLIFRLQMLVRTQNSASLYFAQELSSCDSVSMVNNTGFNSLSSEEHVREIYLSSLPDVLVATKAQVDQSTSIANVKSLNLSQEFVGDKKISVFTNITDGDYTPNKPPSVSFNSYQIATSQTNPGGTPPCSTVVTFSLGTLIPVDIHKSYQDTNFNVIANSQTNNELVLAYDGGLSTVIEQQGDLFQTVTPPDTSSAFYGGINLSSFTDNYKMVLNAGSYTGYWGEYDGSSITYSFQTVDNSLDISNFPAYGEYVAKKISKVFAETDWNVFDVQTINTTTFNSFIDRDLLVKDFMYIAVEYGKP
jgi:hypothetical protein